MVDWNGPQVFNLYLNAATLGNPILGGALLFSSLWRWCRWCGGAGGVDLSPFFQPRQSQFVDDVAGVQRYLATPSKHKRERRASYSDDSVGLLLQQVVRVV